MTPEKWTPAAGFILEPNADQAVRERHRNVAVTAGPGAGKTELLAQRADYLLRSGECRYPRRILAISFKIDAARNLQRRAVERCGASLAARLDSHTFHAFAKRLIDRYRVVLTGADALDPDYVVGTARVQRRSITFDDFVPLALAIIDDCPMLRTAIGQTYSHVFLDEFQDCNANQYALIRSLFADGEAVLTAVGDTKQRIMRFAGALEGIYARYAADFDAKSLNLYQNYRSQPRLRRMQNRMVQAMDPPAALPASEIEGDEGIIDVWHADDEYHEAQRVTQLICHSLSNGVPHGQIAVILAKQLDAYAGALKAELDAHGVSYRDESREQDIFAEPVVRLIYDLLTVVIRHGQPDSYQRLIAATARLAENRGDGDALIARVTQYNATVSSSIASGEINCNEVESVRKIGAGYIELVGIDALRGWSTEYTHGTRLTDLIDSSYGRYADNIEAGCSPSEALRRLADTDAVRLLTVHKAKGLEFDLVVFMAIEDETFWAEPDDERAVFFVGISRAKRHLVLTTAVNRTCPPGIPAWRWDAHRTPHGEFLDYLPD